MCLETGLSSPYLPPRPLFPLLPLLPLPLLTVQDERHRAAALKNAYVLTSQRRFSLAATFFLLGGDVTSAASVCVRSLRDPQLALVICRLRDDKAGPAAGAAGTVAGATGAASARAGGGGEGSGVSASSPPSLMADVITRLLLPAAEEAGDVWQCSILQVGEVQCSAVSVGTA